MGVPDGPDGGGNRRIHLQWVPDHCELALAGNEQVDAITKEVAALPQLDVPADVRTIYRAASQMSRAEAVRDWPEGWYKRLMSSTYQRRCPARHLVRQRWTYISCAPATGRGTRSTYIG